MSRQIVIEQARELLAKAVVIDTETTGLGESDTVVELAAVVASTGQVLTDLLIEPSSPMNPAAAAVHGLDERDCLMKGTPLDAAIRDMIKATPKGLTYTGFNWAFDRRLIMQGLYFQLGPLYPKTRADFLTIADKNKSPCIMQLANRFFNEHAVWDKDWLMFQRLSLERCLELAGIEREDTAHPALSDAKAAAGLLRHIADSRS